MKINDKVIVSGKGRNGVVYLEHPGSYQGFSKDVISKVKIKLYNGVVEEFDQDSVRLWDYK
ncbi:hypothetical protein [Paenibacillus chitinolyticus]|uniref:KOW domain-containing protein n=1 Tax=Paenibacillus chitinolyticus TaxID=79263 RepID=A0ABT4FMU7_9BACL|nr:hypothetical protein [Paenibacillus chitinolyticus]MCY9592388.1 hypothetical protein [Paenibacillus chitinolyticus]MCY9599849.1 hypothetical protein [Paenibacillus chitinolyticus]